MDQLEEPMLDIRVPVACGIELCSACWAPCLGLYDGGACGGRTALQTHLSVRGQDRITNSPEVRFDGGAHAEVTVP
jgi:hypothetical protein